jgi:ABC-2 type transport system ATP-binding protein
MAKDIVVSVKHLYKSFKLPHERRNSLKERVLSFSKPTYEKQKALEDINFEVEKGEFFGVVGRNGSGKSTLLKLLGGIYQPSKGSITVNGTLTPFIELGIGFNPELTGRENVFLNGAILGLTRKEVKAKYQEIVDFAELERFMDQKLKNYSSGMQVRLAFSIAIQAHNDILLIDEVLAVGDASFQRKCFETFKDIKQSDKTVIFVSHDMSAIREYCDRAIMIEGGKIVSEGAPEKVANDYLQLFNDEATKSVDKGQARWGDQKAEISDITIKHTDKVVDISYKITANESVDNPIYGLILRDLDNHHLFDSNTKWKKVVTGKLSKGETAQASWSIPNVLKTGRYKVTVAVAHKDGLGFYDWQENASSFYINRTQDTAGLVLIDDTLRVIKG